jgi:hypothetical protein
VITIGWDNSNIAHRLGLGVSGTPTRSHYHARQRPSRSASSKFPFSRINTNQHDAEYFDQSVNITRSLLLTCVHLGKSPNRSASHNPTAQCFHRSNRKHELRGLTAESVSPWSGRCPCWVILDGSRRVGRTCILCLPGERLETL